MQGRVSSPPLRITAGNYKSFRAVKAHNMLIALGAYTAVINFLYFIAFFEPDYRFKRIAVMVHAHAYNLVALDEFG